MEPGGIEPVTGNARDVIDSDWGVHTWILDYTSTWSTGQLRDVDVVFVYIQQLMTSM